MLLLFHCLLYVSSKSQKKSFFLNNATFVPTLPNCSAATMFPVEVSGIQLAYLAYVAGKVGNLECFYGKMEMV